MDVQTNETPVECLPARVAAIECIEATRGLYDVAVTCDRDHPPDYRPHVSRLYDAIWRAWPLIWQVWPELADADRALLPGEPAERTMPAPVAAWIFAKWAFFAAVGGTSHEESALAAWENWGAGYIPEIEEDPFYPRDDVNTWIRLRAAASPFPQDFWQQLISAVEVTPLPMSGGSASIPPRPAAVIRGSELPTNAQGCRIYCSRSMRILDLSRVRYWDGKATFGEFWNRSACQMLSLRPIRTTGECPRTYNFLAQKSYTSILIPSNTLFDGSQWLHGQSHLNGL